MSDSELRDIEQAALDALGRREYARAELQQRLCAKGFAADAVSSVLDSLVERQWLSDERFAEAFVRVYSQKGQGPLRVRQGLQSRGVESELVGLSLENQDIDWFQLAREVRIKRFGEELPDNPKSRAQQSRFLYYRGFNSDQVRYALSSDD